MTRTSGRAQLTHPVRHAMDSLCRCAIRGRYGHPESRFNALGGVPDHRPMASISLPYPGFPRYRFP